MHDIYMKEICIIHKKMDFLTIFSGYIIPTTFYMEVNCVLLSIHTFILHLHVIFMPFYTNDGTAQVTHFSSTLIFPIRYTYHNIFSLCYCLILLL